MSLRNLLLERLEQLPPSQFDEVLFRLESSHRENPRRFNVGSG